MPDYSETCDYESLRRRISDVLRRYFEIDDNGDPNESFDPDYTAQAAIDDIHDILGTI